MCQKHADYNVILQESKDLVNAYFAKITPWDQNDETKFKLALINLADIVGTTGDFDAYKPFVDENVLFDSQSGIDSSSLNIALFERFESVTVDKSNAADTFDKMIYTWSKLLT